MVAPDLFLTPVDWLLNFTDHLAFLGTTIGTKPFTHFTDLDFADDVALLTEMLSILVLALEIMSHEAKSLGLQVNWLKTKIQTTDTSFHPGSLVPVAEDNVEIVELFAYLGVDINNTGSSEHDIMKGIAIARNCVASLDRNIWHSYMIHLSPHQVTTLGYRVFILPVVLYGAETWSPARQLARNLDAFDQCGIYYTFPGGSTLRMRRSTDVLINHHLHTSSIPPTLSSSVTLHVPIHLWTTVEPLGHVWPLAEGLELPITPTASHLAPDC